MVFAAAGACGGTTAAPAPVCTAGVTQSCLCVGGGTGVQSCKDDGSGFAACDCGAGDTGASDTPVDSDVDASLSDTGGSALPDTEVADSTGDTAADVAMDSGPADAPGDAGSGSTYSEAFTKGVTSTSQCTSWDTWRKSLSETKVYTMITVKGPADPSGKSCTDMGVSGPKADSLCQALRTGVSVSHSCGGDTWQVNLYCGTGTAVGLIVNSPPCGCGTGYAVRPCIGSDNWGGINGATCAAESQTMTVTCE
ncbi:MAG: hypothetical protein HYV09_36220 [Deltaproteobacteria bacterium]|nr:hypothetical protein [Deltaproteobacteria bacterium]